MVFEHAARQPCGKQGLIPLVMSYILPTFYSLAYK